jgi:hypothetical protein
MGFEMVQQGKQHNLWVPQESIRELRRDGYIDEILDVKQSINQSTHKSIFAVLITFYISRLIIVFCMLYTI